jgi:hypothetical protein
MGGEIMETQTALSTITVLPSTKEQRRLFVAKAKNEILSGEVEPLKIDAILKSAEDTIKEIRTDKDIKSAVQNQAGKYPEKSFEYGNFTITKSSRKAYDWKNYKSDQTLNDLTAEMEKLELVIEARQMTVLSGFDPATGETFAPVPFLTTEILSYKLK